MIMIVINYYYIIISTIVIITLESLINVLLLSLRYNFNSPIFQGLPHVKLKGWFLLGTNGVKFFYRVADHPGMGTFY